MKIHDLDLDNLPNGAKIVIKDGWFWNLLGFFVKLVSLGKNTAFMTTFTTTIGNTIAMPVKIWDMRLTEPEWFYRIVMHELEHVRQFKKRGFGSIKLGVLIHGISYVLLPLPIGAAYIRYAAERDAYIEGFRAIWALDPENPDIEDLRQYEIDKTYEYLTGGAYGYTMSFFKKWVKKDLTKRFYNVRV